MLLTSKETAEKLSIKLSKLRSMVFYKKIPYVKIGRLVRFRSLDIEKFINDNVKEQI